MTRSQKLVLGAALLLAACQVTSHEPVKIEVLSIQMTADELVCHVRNISQDQGLSFHYGTSEQSFGTMATFRLIGDEFELLLLNPQKPFTYDLSAYDV